MHRKELKKLWSDILRSPDSSPGDYDRLAKSVVEVYRMGDADFRQHIKNRSARIAERTGQHFDVDDFNIEMARAFIADEIGFSSWTDLIDAISVPSKRKYPILVHYAIAALWRGDFTALDETIGGSGVFDDRIVDWYESGYLTDEPEATAELFAAACWLGHAKTAEYLLDKGVDPYAGMRTGLSGFHWAASSGQLEVVKLLTSRNVPTEVKGMYDNTVLGQALWSAINEHTDDHAAIVETLIDAGAHVGPKTLEWWLDQNVPSVATKERIADALRRHDSS